MFVRFYKPFFGVLVCTVFFTAGIFTANHWGLFATDYARGLRAGRDNFTYINPLLLCQDYEQGDFAEFVPLKKEIERITATAKKDDTILAGSVYFRDLTNGRWMGFHEEELYTPASLLKVPILIAYLKAAETDKNILQEQVYYEQEAGQKPPLVEDFVLTSGHTYSIWDLIRGMIVDSDNSARAILESRAGKSFLDEVYSELGIPSPYEKGGDYRISTKTYALFFRVLYNATYLSRDMSEKAFDVLTQAKFDKGLRAGTPADIPIAHKYGYHIVKKEPPRIIELSDCGVVYNPAKPYILCVMARGTDPEITSTYMKDVAAATDHLLFSK